MDGYKAPLRDMEFVIYELLDFESHWQSIPAYQETSRDLVQAILGEAAKFSENVIAPLDPVGDREGCHWQDGVVTTPTGYKEAYQQYIDAGWSSMTHDPEYGGQGLPIAIGEYLREMTGCASWSWSSYPGLSDGAMSTLAAHGTEEQKQMFLTKLVSGRWTGTMCLTEPHCGTDLGLIRTKAEPQVDGTYAISGTKIFITSGDHDVSENIVHVVLARMAGAPSGTKGLSLFLVPKYKVAEDGEAGESNGVGCGSIEHKMGLNGSATCVMNFEEATGYLIGEAGRGLNCMFTFMNMARIGTALQGVATAEQSFQKALSYARERLQMRSLTGVKNPDGPADPIIVHPDVRRMLLTQKAFAEGGRMLMGYCYKLVEVIEAGNDQDAAKRADQALAFLTPIAKAFLTEAGCECANLAVQCYGGHGFIKENGVEQLVRDSKIATLYEGTTGVQALDLLGRKVLMSQGEAMKPFVSEIQAFCSEHRDSPFAAKLLEMIQQWGDLTMKIGVAAMENPDELGAASVDYLMFSGYITLAYFWAQAAQTSQQALDNGAGETEFYTAKIQTARFYFSRLLPRTNTLAETMLAGAEDLMSMDEEAFAF